MHTNWYGGRNHSSFPVDPPGRGLQVFFVIELGLMSKECS